MSPHPIFTPHPLRYFQPVPTALLIKGKLNMKKFCSLVLISILLSASGFAQPGKNKAAAPANAPAQFGNAEAITAEQLKDYLSFIASDEMEGRDTPSKGLDITAKFIATMLSRWGIQPAGDNGTYFQKMSLHRNKLEPEGTITTINGQTFKFGDDFLARPRGGSVSGQCVYVGHGWVIKDKNINSYQTETGTINCAGSNPCKLTTSGRLVA